MGKIVERTKTGKVREAERMKTGYDELSDKVHKGNIKKYKNIFRLALGYKKNVKYKMIQDYAEQKNKEDIIKDMIEKIDNIISLNGKKYNIQEHIRSIQAAIYNDIAITFDHNDGYNAEYETSKADLLLYIVCDGKANSEKITKMPEKNIKISVVDLQKTLRLIKTGKIKKPKEKLNRTTGQTFLVISIRQLYENGCLLFHWQNKDFLPKQLIVNQKIYFDQAKEVS